VKASEVIDTLSHLIDSKLPVFIWGAPGIGKSSIVKEIAKDKDLEFLDLRLSLLDPTDMKGIPFFDSENKQGVWAPPSFLPSDKDSRGILFLDEINSAPPAVQASAYQLVLDRRVGEYELPQGWSIVAAGNRESDRGVVYRMPPPLANRFVHLEMDIDVEDWKKWAYRNGISESLIAYISYEPEALFNFDKDNTQKAFATPRSWSFVDTILKSSLPQDLLLDAISGAVGKERAVSFLSFKQVESRLPDISAIIEGRAVEIESDAKLLTILISGIVSRLKRDSKIEHIDNILDFSMRLPKEFAILLIKELQLNSIDIESSSRWGEWVDRFAYLLV